MFWLQIIGKSYLKSHLCRRIHCHSHRPFDQTGFTPNGSCWELSSKCIEAGFQDKKKTAEVLLKLAELIKCKETIIFISSMLLNPILRVFIDVAAYEQYMEQISSLNFFSFHYSPILKKLLK